MHWKADLAPQTSGIVGEHGYTEHHRAINDGKGRRRAVRAPVPGGQREKRERHAIVEHRVLARTDGSGNSRHRNAIYNRSDLLKSHLHPPFDGWFIARKRPTGIASTCAC